MNTSVFALEVSDSDVASVDSIEGNEVTGEDYFANIDEFTVDNVNGHVDGGATVEELLLADGWDTDGESFGAGASYSNHILTVGTVVTGGLVNLYGTCDSSALTVQSGYSNGDADDYKEVLGFDYVEPSNTVGKSTTIKLLSNNALYKKVRDDAFTADPTDPDEGGGYRYCDGFDGNDVLGDAEYLKNNIFDDEDVSAVVDTSHAFEENGGYILYTFTTLVAADDDDDDNGSSTPSKSVSGNVSDNELMAKNQPAGKTTVTLGSGVMTYYTKVPYFGNKLDKNSFKNVIGNVTISQGGVTYTVAKASLKYVKGSKKAILKVSKISGGSDKKTQKAIKKAINNKKIQVDVYPFNLDAVSTLAKGKLTGKQSKGTLKFSGIIPGGSKFNLKNGKTVAKIGGTAEVKLSGNSVVVKSNAMIGSISTNKIKNKSK